MLEYGVDLGLTSRVGRRVSDRDVCVASIVYVLYVSLPPPTPLSNAPLLQPSEGEDKGNLNPKCTLIGTPAFTAPELLGASAPVRCAGDGERGGTGRIATVAATTRFLVANTVFVGVG